MAGENTPVANTEAKKESRLDKIGGFFKSIPKKVSSACSSCVSKQSKPNAEPTSSPRLGS